MECEFCRTMRELEARLAESPGDSRPVFSYTLPQNVHIAVASKRTVPEDHAYPGFFAPVAESVRQVDECFGEFLAFLRRSTLGRRQHRDSHVRPWRLAGRGRALGPRLLHGAGGHADSAHHARADGSARSRPRGSPSRQLLDRHYADALRAAGSPAEGPRSAVRRASAGRIRIASSFPAVASRFCSRRATARCTECSGTTAAALHV